MKLIILASLILLCSVLSSVIKRQKKESKTSEQTFWEREHRANSTRRKSLDGLEYITIPMDRFPLHILQENTTVAECMEIIATLSTQPVVNLTGYSNTDLKLEYGTANITPLTEYDQNYTLMVRTLQKWADILLEEGYAQEAETLMEFAVSTRTDISRTYYKLAELYACRLETEQVQALIATAEALPTMNKNSIVRTLRESYL